MKREKKTIQILRFKKKIFLKNAVIKAYRIFIAILLVFLLIGAGPSEDHRAHDNLMVAFGNVDSPVRACRMKKESEWDWLWEFCHICVGDGGAIAMSKGGVYEQTDFNFTSHFTGSKNPNG